MRLDRAARHIVVADDSKSYRTILQSVLTEAGYRVTPAADGERLLELLEDDSSLADMLVLELNLPRVRGIDVLRKVRDRECYRDLPVLVFTEFLSEHLKQVLAELGVRHYVNKYQALRDLLYQVDGILFPADKDQRRSERKLGHLPVNYWVGDRLYLQYCFDLCADGMFIIVTDEPPPAELTMLTLRFWLPSSDKLVAAQAEVVWLNTPDEGLRISHPPGMGVRFVDLESEDATLIGDYVSDL